MRVPRSFVLVFMLLLASGPLAAPVVAQDGPAIIPVLASSELAKGPNRFLFGLTDATGDSIAAPDVAVHLAFYDLDDDPGAVVFETDARFLWAIEDERGLYAADATFPRAGRWGTNFVVTFPDGTTASQGVPYDVHEEPSTPAIGAPAPAVDTPTAATVDGDLAAISTDPAPEPRLYERSIAEAVVTGEPAVIAFVTPGFCQSATCGPTIEKVKAVASAHPEGITFVHVEPYVMTVRDGTLQPELSAEGFLQAAPWTEAYGLLTEPFVIVVDADGLVRAKFEGAVTTDELESALAEASIPL